MNIAIFTDTYLPDINGVVTSTSTLYYALKKHGHNVLIVTTSLPKNSNYEDREDIIRIPGIDIKKIYGYRASTFYSSKAMRQIREFQPDIIHAHTEFGVGIFSRIVAEELDIPLVYTYHTMWADYSHYLSGGIKSVDGIMKKIIKKLSKVYGNHCSRMLVPSQKTKDILSTYSIQTPIDVVSTGLDFSDFYQKDNDKITRIKSKYHLNEKKVLLYVGRVASEKNIELLIDAMEQLQDFIFMIVGSGPQIQDYIDDVKNRRLEESIIFTGEVPHSDIPVYYHCASVFISASETETQGLTYLEAMASGISVIAKYDKNLDNVIMNGKNGYFFNDKDEFIKIVHSLDDNMLTQLSLNAIESSKNFDDENFYKNIIHIYKEVIELYKTQYKVQSITKNEKKYDILFKNGSQQLTLTINKTSLERYQLKEGNNVDKETIEALLDIEKATEAYNKALHYLSYKDYTYNEMKDKLFSVGLYDDIQVDIALEYLLEKNLINDYDYANNFIQLSLNKGQGYRLIIEKLKNKGIKESIIQDVLNLYTEEMEYEQAVKLVDKLYHSNTNKSPKLLLNSIKEKLFNKGFSSSNIEKVMNTYDFTFERNHTLQLLQKEYFRIYQRYSKKYKDKELKNKIVQYLLYKGYEYNDISIIMADLWEDNHDN